MNTCEPDPECCICGGTGIEKFSVTDNSCECTYVCDCGEEHAANLQSCAAPGCQNTGCDACGSMEYCADDEDDWGGEYFCEMCRGAETEVESDE